MPARYRAAVWLAAMTSLRSGELFALSRTDYNPATRKLRVARALELEASASDFGEVKATASLRTVTVPDIAAEPLEVHLATYTGSPPTSLVFTTASGGLVYPDRIGKAFDRARAKAGRPDLTWHDLRHTGQSLAARVGAGMKELQARAGHSTSAAASRYLHLYDDADRRVAERMDVLVREELAMLDRE
nr:tyrosine-type recombinase/integrase [Cellulomonas sp. APG4]